MEHNSEALSDAFFEIQTAIGRATDALQHALDNVDADALSTSSPQLDSLLRLAESLNDAGENLQEVKRVTTAVPRIGISKVGMPARRIKTNRDPYVDCAAIGRDRKRCEEYARCTWSGNFKGCSIDRRFKGIY